MDKYFIDKEGNKFVWDTEKDKLNFRKHGLTFKEATEVFRNHYGVLTYDENHSVDEDRYKIIGEIKGTLIAAVIVTYRGEYKRIISARYASPHEKEMYYDGYSTRAY